LLLGQENGGFLLLHGGWFQLRHACCIVWEHRNSREAPSSGRPPRAVFWGICAGTEKKLGTRGIGRNETWVIAAPISCKPSPRCKLRPCRQCSASAAVHAMRRRATPHAQSDRADGPTFLTASRSPVLPKPGADVQRLLHLATTLNDDTALTLAGACSCMLMASDDAQLAKCRQRSEDRSGAICWFSVSYHFVIRSTGGPTRGRTETRFERPSLCAGAKFLATGGRDDTSAAAERGDGAHE